MFMHALLGTCLLKCGLGITNGKCLPTNFTSMLDVFGTLEGVDFAVGNALAIRYWSIWYGKHAVITSCHQISY